MPFPTSEIPSPALVDMAGILRSDQHPKLPLTTHKNSAHSGRFFYCGLSSSKKPILQHTDYIGLAISRSRK